jgi:hypothetical protein
MSATVRGALGGGRIVMGPDFSASRVAQGKWTATGEFRVLRGDFERNDVYAKFQPGNSIGGIASGSLSSAWNFLLIEKVDPQDEPGGITVVRVSFTGFTENQWDFDADQNKTYTRTGTTVEKSILDHPLFKEDVSSPADVEAFRMAMAGTWRERSDAPAGTAFLVAATGSDAVLYDITDPTVYEWWVEVIQKGNHTYLAPAMEWTESTTGSGKLTAGEFSKLGYIDTPSGNPAAPPDETWLFTAVTEDIQRIGDGPNSYSRTWTSGKWNTKIYTKP